jgi:hypothetical protein
MQSVLELENCSFLAWKIDFSDKRVCELVDRESFPAWAEEAFDSPRTLNRPV